MGIFESNLENFIPVHYTTTTMGKGDAARGAKIFKTKCSQCHVVQEGVNKQGPSLFGLIGRQSGSVPNFAYTESNKNSGITWTKKTLSKYLTNPKKMIPGKNDICRSQKEERPPRPYCILSRAKISL